MYNTLSLIPKKCYTLCHCDQSDESTFYGKSICWYFLNKVKSNKKDSANPLLVV
uniref:Uncharacterized protein n=1 Tax=Anguilla anguilla TaxID=7936 RepID=A0A0E9TU66_ANGAN